MSAIRKRERPKIEIRCTGGANLGRCYNAAYYKITSTHRLSREQIIGLRNLHLLGSGQEFRINSQCDGKEEPAGFDTVNMIDTKTGEIAINRYSGKQYEPVDEPYYEYQTETRVDSSD